MSNLAATELLDPKACEQARRSRDSRFDGLFFTAVPSTRIYCRPVCPAPFAKRADYYPTAAAAEADGYRPCLRCRPELSPEDGAWRRGDAVLARALKLIDQGFLGEHALPKLAERVNVGDRQLRRLFVERLGAPPAAVHGTRRLLFAKQLLTETALPITEVALASGFGSVRRFNAAFLAAYRMAPRDLRQHPHTAAQQGGDTLILRLGYRPPYDFDAVLDFLRSRALPGMEVVDANSYSRAISNEHGTSPGWLRISAWPNDEHALRLELHAAQATRLLDIVGRLRRMFDLDADPHAIAATLAHDPRLAPLLAQHPGLRIPSGWDGFEIAVRAILGQQVSVAAARTFATRIVHRFGQPLRAEPTALEVTCPGLDRLFPAPSQLADIDLSDPRYGIGLTRARAATVRTVARGLLDGNVDFHPERTLEEFVARWSALSGIGPWTAHYLALRALGHPDAFPAEDLVLRDTVPTDGSRMTPAALRTRAQHWRPWRGYAVLQLWRASADSAADQSKGPAPLRIDKKRRKTRSA